MARTIGVTIREVNLSGKGGRANNVRIQKGGDKQAGPTVSAALAKAKVSAARRDLTVNGQPATGKTHLKNGDEIVVSERPSGS
jgi:hypothetical protein